MNSFLSLQSFGKSRQKLSNHAVNVDECIIMFEELFLAVAASILT
jgi:phage terminase large subunit-like protein